ncbi:tetratricopeptide repeat protein [Bacteroidetes/Chlorobi group bacterium Naka2016]|jgi:tetratricopeptide (TPR) repeat protein|nr:MAG: tetratricopeptide repeat protein [Bacteroidetes/Chlorobi group bacterium Naka2016]
MDIFSNPISLIEYANSELTAGNHSKVIEVLEEGIQLYDEFPLLFLLLARAYFEIDDVENARKTIQVALEKFPFNKSLQQFYDELQTKAKSFSVTEENHSHKNINSIIFPFRKTSSGLFANRLLLTKSFLHQF